MRTTTASLSALSAQESARSASRPGRWLVPLAATVVGAVAAYKMTSPHCEGTEYNTYCLDGVAWGLGGAFFGFVGGIIVAGIVFE